MAAREISNDSFITDTLSKIDNFFTGHQISNFDKDINLFIQSLLAIVATYLTCWILYRGYKILWGRSNDNFRDFLWDAFLKFIFIYICIFPDDWIHLVKEAINGFREVASIGDNTHHMAVPNLLQNYYNNTKAITLNLIGNSNGFDILVIIIYSILVWIGFFIGAFGLIVALITNTISFYILLFIAPIAFYSLIFGSFLKNIFSQWIGMIISNIITLFFIHLFCGYALTFVISRINMALNDIGRVGEYEIVVVCIISGICLQAFVRLILALAEKMSSVSLESATAGAIKGGMTTLGANAGFGLLANKKGIQGLLLGAKGSTKAYPAIKTGSTKLANGITSGGKFLLDKIRKTGGK